jgi:hypothetical protein
MTRLFRRRRQAFAVLASLSLWLGLEEAQVAVAQPTIGMRSTFPGRRIGGNTRGASRPLVHLVPASLNSTFVPATAGRIGILESPSGDSHSTADLCPLQLEFRAISPDGKEDPNGRLLFQRTLLPEREGITLLSLPSFGQPTAWTSTYRCSQAASASIDLLPIGTSVTPPPLTLLLPPANPLAEDRKVQALLERVAPACGGTISTQEMMALFELPDKIKEGEWPAKLAVRCP